MFLLQAKPVQPNPMLRPVWPSTTFWFIVAYSTSYLWWMTVYLMHFFAKLEYHNLVILNFFLIFLLVASNVMVVYLAFKTQKRSNNPFHGYERLGKIVGGTVMLFGNILIHYVTENTIACMLFFLFLAFYWHCVLCVIQPYTDFGILGFLLGASLNKAWSLFGFNGHT
ncbi:hypothetical protein ACSBR2_033127 [Camellia fascicularis]